ncbi:hypothetical protein PAESOLCIP111_05814 [Paenibacillus solanacearum]|uniref:Glycosyltransferase 2-like domain-containing protein n=1 Tax=Paenibacillus solanacearum TaxID=2048548 RepID=A0A916K6S4_9BACL|nr:glycosyltransferase [Paenibacillus solanacearum]CAG7649196.1 hypothetical protein PAESOLCIP111_05814 [Paenibacillus solanacearum]
MKHPSISLCMIVKDEERHLARCLQSVKGIVDEMVVVDTGSVDATPQIAEQFGAKVIRVPWKGDFAYARNAGIDAAQGEWILILDADEEVDLADGPKLKACAEHMDIDGFLFQIHNHVGDKAQQGITINTVIRMFRNLPPYRYEGRIHEQIATSMYRHKPNCRLHIMDVAIHHYGYQPSIVTEKNKIRRNVELLLETLAEHPNNPFHLYNLGVEYLRMGQQPKALDAFRKARSFVVSPQEGYVHLLYKYEVSALRSLGQLQEALRLCEQAIRTFPDYTDLHHLKGVCHLAAGERTEAKAAFAMAMQLGKPPASYHTEDGMGTYQTSFMLGTVHEATGDYDEAIHCYVRTLQHGSGLNPPLYRLFRLFRVIGTPERTIELLRERIHMNSPEAEIKVARMLLELGCVRAAEAVIGGMDRSSYESVIMLMEAESRLMGGDPIAARELLTRLGSESELAPEASFHREDLCFYAGLLAGEASSGEDGRSRSGNDGRVTAHRLVRRWDRFKEEGHNSGTIHRIVKKDMYYVLSGLVSCDKTEDASQFVDACLQVTGPSPERANGLMLGDGLAYALVAWADSHLEKVDLKSGTKELVSTSRLALPSLEGFPGERGWGR